MKKEYIRPQYENNNQLEDVILASVIADEESETVTGIIDSLDLWNWN